MKLKKTIISLFIITTLLLNACSTSSSSTEEVSTTNSINVDSETEISDTDEITHSITNLEEITVHKASIELTDEDWKDILDNAIEEEFHTATITYDGITLENVAFRTKGNSSLSSIVNSDSERYGFKIKTNKYVDNQYLNGTNEFVLNASFSDPSYLREYITYGASDFLGLITPETEFVELTINGEYYGLYLRIESYDDSFMENNTSSDDAQLYKADSDNCTLTIEDGISGFELKEGNDENLEKLQELIDTLDTSNIENMDDLENILDISSVLKYAALNYTFGSYDSYIGEKAHNYFLIYNDNKFEMLGWDYNMSFGGYPKDNGSSLYINSIDLYQNTTSTDRPLISKLLEKDEYNSEYLEYIEKLKIWLSNYDSALYNMGTQISEYVETDPTAFYTIEEFWENIQGTNLSLEDIPTPILIDADKQPNGNMPDGRPPNTEMMNKNESRINNSSQDTISINDYIRLKLEN